jgi:hypothetical protein
MKMYYAHIVDGYINLITKNKKEAYEYDRDYTLHNWGNSEVISGLVAISDVTGLSPKEIKEL